MSSQSKALKKENTVSGNQASDNGSGISFAGLDPVLGNLGVMIGLLSLQDKATEAYDLIPTWFEDPITKTKAGFSANPKELGQLLGQLLGDLGGNANGIPQSDPAILGQWYPIDIKGKPTGLYLVTIDNEEDKSTALGLGVLKKWGLPTDPATPVIDVDVWALLPAVVIKEDGSFSLTFTQEKNLNPISIGVAVEGSKESSPIINENGIQFNGVKFSANLFLSSDGEEVVVEIPEATQADFELTLEILQLQLAEDPKPRNYSLADLEAITGQEILETAVNLFVGALSNKFQDEKDQILYMAPLFGFSNRVPNNDTHIPVLEWFEIFKLAADQKDPLSPFIDWFNALTSNPDLLKIWMGTLSGFLGFTIDDTTVTGNGSRSLPYTTPIISIGDVGKLNFTLASVVVDEGHRYLYPGLSFTSNGISLGESDAVFIMEADLELAKFQLSGQPKIDLDLSFKANFALEGKGNGLLVPEVENFSLGRMTGGLELALLSGKIVPHLELIDLTLPPQSVALKELSENTDPNKFGVVNLLSPGQLADVGSVALSAALQQLMGLNQDNPSVFLKSLAALIGLVQPKDAPDSWPITPFSETGIPDSIKDPITAWEQYYISILEAPTPAEGERPFTYILQSFASLLQVGDAAIKISGSGTPKCPWLLGISIGDTTMPAYLTAYEVYDQTTGDLAMGFGLELAPVLTLAGIEISPVLGVDAVHIDFPKDKGAVAKWFSGVFTRLELPKPVSTPSFGGTIFSVDFASLIGGWYRNGGWNWSMKVDAPSLKIGDAQPIKGADLNFGEKTTLENLVKQSADSFGPFFAAILGTALMRTETKMGLLISGTLGLLTDFSAYPIFKQSGLSWEGFTVLKLDDFSEPLKLLRSQLAANLDTPAKAKSQLELISWTLSDDEKATEISGTGSFADPYLTPLPFGFSMPFWYDSTTEILGLGIGRLSQFSYPSTSPTISVDVLTRLNILEYNLKSGAIVSDGNCPSLEFQARIGSPKGPLINLPNKGGTLSYVDLGIELSINNGKLQFAPLVDLFGAILPGETSPADIDLQQYLSKDFDEQSKSGFVTLLNLGVQAAIAVTQDKTLFEDAYDILFLLGLVIDKDRETETPVDKYGVNSAGWTALLADPMGYIEQELLKLITTSQNRAALLKLVNELTGLNIPTIPPTALYLFQGLKIVGPAAQNYPLYLNSVLELASNPIKGIYDRFTALIQDTDLLKSISKELAKKNPVANFGPFTLSTTPDGEVTLAIPTSKPFNIGGGTTQDPIFSIFGSLGLNLNNKKLSASLNTYVPTIGFSLQNVIGVTDKAGTITVDKPKVQLIWGDGNTPAAPVLPILPFNSNTFLNDIAYLAPVYALNAIVNAVFEDELLQKYPVAQSVLEAFGIAEKDTTTGKWNMNSLFGLLLHPLDWVLSEDHFGDNGQFSIAKLVDKFAAFPTASYTPPGLTTPIKIAPTASKDGISISGFPYNFYVNLSGDKNTKVAQFEFGSEKIQIAGDKGELDNLQFQLNLTPDYQPSFAGSFDLATTYGASVFTHLGFDKGFQFSINSGTPATPTASLQFLPFKGWGNLIGGAAAFAAAEAIDVAVPKLLEYLKPKAPNFVTALEDFGTNIPVATLIQTIIGIVSGGGSENDILTELEEKSLDWLKGLFDNSTQLPKTTQAVLDIFKQVPDVGKLSVNTEADGLLEYVPSDKLPLTVLFGLNKDSYLGLWAELTIPGMEYLSVNIARTGIGVDLASLSKLDFNFGLEIIVPLENKNGPGLFLKYDPQSVFQFGVDPVANIDKPNDLSKYALEIAPTFNAPPNWLLSVIKNVLPRYVSVLVLNNASVLKWLNYNLFSLVPANASGAKITPIELLTATTLVVKDGQDYVLNSLDEIARITPESFLGNILKDLLQNEITLVDIGEDGKITVGKRKEKDPSDNFYGIRLVAPDFKIKSLPNLVLQLGGKDASWIKDSSTAGSKNAEIQSGIQFYIPIDFSPVSIDFEDFNIILGNVGFDIVGKNGQPIVDTSRFKLGAVEPRALFSVQFQKGGDPVLIFGGNLTLAEMSLSLAPNQLSGGGSNGEAGNSTNPIASNLLGSGSTAEDGDKKNPPANPTFSVQAAYTDDIYVNLSSTTSEGEEIIIPVQRGFGPLFIDSLGLGWEKDKKILDLIFTGDVTLAGLKISLIGLDVGVPVTTPTTFKNYTIDLAGLDVSYKGGSVAINGGLLKVTQGDDILYNGAAVVKAASFSLIAMGSYAQIKDPERDNKKVTSLFVFAALDVPLGGPPAFFITGVAAGFGYNRSLAIPTVEEVMNFKMVSGVLNGDLTGSNDPQKALNELSTVVAPEVGEYWFAAGLKFMSFELINTAALVFVKFGKEFEIDILGLSYAALPPALGKDDALVYFELAIKVSIKPSVGIISVEAQLTPNSFVLTKDCKITGGFAFYLWYKDIDQVIDGKSVSIPKGQFVITLGGYHPQFQAPVYYPTVPRLGIQWNIVVPVGKLSIDGGSYFAICPTAIMAGGYLKVLFVAGPLKAWLDAYANFLIEWKPFYFSVGIGITLGASFGFTISGVSITISAELGAQLHLEGPPINGHVKVEWTVISFTIPFGDQTTATTNSNLKSWDAFAVSFLPVPGSATDQQQKIKDSNATQYAKLKGLTDDPPPSKPHVIKWNAASGLQNSNDNKKNDADEKWVANTMFYSFNLASSIPTNKLEVTYGTNSDPKVDYTATGPAVGIRPMGYQTDLESPIVIQVLKDNVPQELVSRNITLVNVLDGSPAALWSKSSLPPGQAPSGDNMIIKSTLTGLSLTADKYLYVGNIPAFPISRMVYTRNPIKLLPFALIAKYGPSLRISQNLPFTQIMTSIMSSDVITKRNGIYTALANIVALPPQTPNPNPTPAQQLLYKTKDIVSIDAPLNPDLTVMSTSAGLILQAFPVMAAIGIYQNQGQTVAPVPYQPIGLSLETAQKTVAELASPVLEGVLKRYRTQKLRSKKEVAYKNSAHGRWTNYSENLRNGRTAPGFSVDDRDGAKKMYAGGALVWGLDERATHNLKSTGDLIFLSFSFDPYQQLLDLSLVARKGKMKLPANSAQVAVVAHNPQEHEMVGWIRSTQLTKINPLWAIGDGCLVRVQNAQRLRLGHQAYLRGVTDAGRMLADNSVLGMDDLLEDGWIQTVLFTNSAFVGILLEGENVEDLRVHIELNKVPVNLLRTEPHSIISTKDGNTMVIYSLEEEKCQAEDYIGVIAYSGGADTSIVGIVSIPDPEQCSNGLEEIIKLSYNALDISSDEKEKSVKILISQ